MVFHMGVRVGVLELFARVTTRGVFKREANQLHILTLSQVRLLLAGVVVIMSLAPRTFT